MEEGSARALLTPHGDVEVQADSTTKKKISKLGIVSLALLIASWVSQSEVSKFLQSSAGSGYNSPFFITVFNQSMMILAIPLNLLLLKKDDFLSPGEYLKQHGLSLTSIACHSSYLAVVYCASTFLWFSALGKSAVNVSIASGIYNSSVAWVFILSLVCRVETFSISKSAGVVLALIGVGLGSMSGSSSMPKPISNVTSPSPSPLTSLSRSENLDHSVVYAFRGGYAEVLGSSALYAVFEVLLNIVTNSAVRRAGKCPEAEVPLAVINYFTGGVGLMHILCLSVLLWPMNYYGIETFEWPTADQWSLLGINAAMGTVFNFSFCAALILTSPLFVSVSCLLTIPLAACVDLMRNEANFTGLQVAGMFAICAGFFCFVGVCQKTSVKKKKCPVE